MEPRKFIADELIPVIDGLRHRSLIQSEQENHFDKERFYFKASLVSGGFQYLKGYLEHYIFPKLFATKVTFDRFAFGKVTNKDNVMHIEVLIKF